MEWHLTCNFSPQLSSELVGPCLEAIEAVVAGDDDRLIAINGHTELDGQPLTAGRLVDDLRLEDFLPGGCAA